MSSAAQTLRTAAAALSVLAVASACGQAPSDGYDVVIRGGTVIDGTGAAPFEADVAIRNDRIVAVGEVDGEGSLTIDATGLYVTPGFIDAHSHSESQRLVDGHAPSFSLQGITSEIFGETTSMGPVGGQREGPDLPPGVERDWTTLGGFLESLERRGTAANFGSYVGTGGIRAYVMGYGDRPPSDEELAEMRRLIREAMREGALGISSGMSYVPNIYMSTDELVALAEEAVRESGIYTTHARTANGNDPDAIREAIAIAEATGIAVHFFHLNFTASVSAPEFLSIIREARGRGLSVTGDSYTYTWGITGLSAYLPAWAQEGGTEAMLERLRDPETRRRIAEGFTTDEPALVARVGWDRVRLGVRDPEINGMLVGEVAEMRGVTPEEAFMDVVLEQEGRGIVIDWNNEEETLRQVLAAPFVVGGTDGSAQNLEDEENLPPLAHPRHFGTYPRLLGTYVRDEGLLTWSEAIHKLTGLTAEIVGLEDRGTLEPGKAADVVVFDPETIRGRATFEDPFHYSEGIHHVFVNGVAVVRDAEPTDALPGQALRGPGFESAESDGSETAEASMTVTERVDPGGRRGFLPGPSALEHLYDEDDESGDEQHVDQPARRVRGEESERPEYEEDDRDGHEHGKVSLVLSGVDEGRLFGPYRPRLTAGSGHQCHEPTRDRRDRTGDQHPDRAVRRRAGERFRHLRREGLGCIHPESEQDESSDQQRDSNGSS